MAVEEGASGADDRPIRAKDLKAATGLTYRQLNEWESKGALPSQRDVPDWRRYTVTEALVIAVAKAIRDAFGTPLDSLRWLTHTLLNLGYDPLKWAVQRMRDHHMALLLRTDLKSYVQLGTDVDLVVEFEDGAGRAEDFAPAIVLQLNPIVNRLLRFTTTPDTLSIASDVYDELATIRRIQTVQTLEEMHVLSLLRLKDARSITVTKQRGEIDAAEIEYRVRADRLEAAGRTIQQMLDQLSFGELTQKKENGELTSVTHKVRVKVMSNLDEHGRRLRVAFRSNRV